MGTHEREIDEATWLRAVAFHEAGHAVCAYALGRTFEYATIIPEEYSAGHVRYAPYPPSVLDGVESGFIDFRDFQFVEDSILCTLAGEIAQEEVCKPSEEELESDMYQAVQIGMRLFEKEDMIAEFAWLYRKTRALIQEDYVYSDAVRHIAEMLLEQKTVSEAEVAACVEEFRRQMEEAERMERYYAQETPPGQVSE